MSPSFGKMFDNKYFFSSPADDSIMIKIEQLYAIEISSVQSSYRKLFAYSSIYIYISV